MPPDAETGEEQIPLEESEVDFDDIIDKVGTFGPFQWRVWVIASMFEMPSALCLLFFIFGSADPGWKCAVQDPTNGTEAGNGTGQIMFTNWTSSHQDVCSRGADECEMRVYSEDFTSIVTEWDLVCSRRYIPTLISTGLLAGVGVGAAITGQLADTFGRRHVLILIATCGMLATALQATSVSWQMFAVIRFFVGVFVGGTLVVGYIGPMEVVGRDWRPFCAVMGTWNAGTILLTGLAYFIRDWRHLSLVAGLACLPMALSWFCLTESPRWLIQHNRMQHAARIIRDMAESNRAPVPDLGLLKKIQDQNDLAIKEQTSRKVSYHDLFRSKELTKRTFILLYLWFVCSMTLYAINFNIRDISSNRYLNVIIMALLEMTLHLTILFTAKWFGRKWSLFGYMCMASAMMIAIIICDFTSSLAPTERLAFALLGRAGISAAWTMGYLLSAELFPTVVRNLACAACSMAARVGGVLAPQLAFTFVYNPTIPYAVFSVLTVSCSICILLLPETKDQSLTDALPTEAGCCCFRFSPKNSSGESDTKTVELLTLKHDNCAC